MVLKAAFISESSSRPSTGNCTSNWPRPTCPSASRARPSVSVSCRDANRAKPRVSGAHSTSVIVSTMAMRAALESEGVRELSAEDAAFIREKYPETHHLGHGLLYVKTAPGTGTVKPHAGQELVVNYAGRLLNGTPFDSSYKRGVPFTFRVGTGAVIKGWDEAFLNMTKGEKRTLIVPYWLAYGAAGRPPTIPPKATLVFDVELIDIR